MHANSWVRVCECFNLGDAVANFHRTEGWFGSFPELFLALEEAVAYPGIFFLGGVQQIQLRTEDRENGDLGAVAP